MKKIIVVSLVGFGLSMFAGTGAVRGQAIYGPRTGGTYVPGPPVSPYLDIIRGQNTPAINYYLGTRPEIERRASDAQLRQLEVDFNQRPSAQATEDLLDQQPTLPSTGHYTAFMNTSHYFGGGGGAQYQPGRSGGAPQQPPARPQQQGRGTTGTTGTSGATPPRPR